MPFGANNNGKNRRRRSRFHVQIEWSCGAVLNRDAELQVIAVLCRELAKRGLKIGLSDARPAVVVRIKGLPTLYVTVDASGEFFEWGKPEGRHPVADPAGAALQLAEHVKAQLGVGEGS